MTHPEHRTAAYELANSGAFTIPPLPQWFREPGVDDGYHPWQHTPLDPFRAEILPHQHAVREALGRLADTAPAGLQHRGLEKLVSLDLLAGMTRREAQCSMNFHAWERDHPEELADIMTDPIARELLEQSLAGRGTVGSQLELLLRAPSLSSLDLQVLSMPFGYREQHLPAMHTELSKVLQAMDATVHTEPRWIKGHPPKIAVDPSRSAHSQSDPKGLLVTFKREIATLPDTVRERTISVLGREAWLVLTSIDSGFSQDIVFDMWREPSWQYSRPDFAARVRGYALSRITDREGSIPLSAATYAKRPL